MKIGILQINPVMGDLCGNAAAIMAATQKAVFLGADICVASELALCGYPPTDMLLREEFIDASGKTLWEMAAALQARSLPPVLLGAPVANPVAQGKRIHNAAVLLRDGKVIVICRKVLLSCNDIPDDPRYFEAGVACGMVQYTGWRLTVTVGADIWNDRTFWQGRRTYESDPVADAMGGGADCIVNLTAIPYQMGHSALHDRVLAGTAMRYRVPVLSVNQVGGQDSNIFEGKSSLTNSFGVLTARAAAFAEDVLLVDLVSPGDKPAHVEEDPDAELWRALVTGLRDFVRKCGFSQVVLGLSGGLDSALVAAIAAEALGPDNVWGILLPSSVTSDESSRLAEHLARELGIRCDTIAIASLCAGIGSALDPFFRGAPPDVAEENVQCRVRGTLLMAVANKFGHMLLATANKSELAVGYCTLYGDMCGGLAVIGDLYKSRVYELARWLNRQKGREYIPRRIIERPPSAELREGQTDQDVLPPYEVLDTLLYDHIEQGMETKSLLAVGHDPAVIDGVLGMVRRAEFKRRQSPPALHVSVRPFGRSWWMPVARRGG